MRYRDLKDERDAAIARALEAERLSMKSEFDRVTAEFERERDRLIALAADDVVDAYRRGFEDGRDTMAVDIDARLRDRAALRFDSDVEDFRRKNRS